MKVSCTMSWKGDTHGRKILIGGGTVEGLLGAQEIDTLKNVLPQMAVHHKRCQCNYEVMCLSKKQK